MLQFLLLKWRPSQYLLSRLLGELEDTMHVKYLGGCLARTNWSPDFFIVILTEGQRMNICPRSPCQSLRMFQNSDLLSPSRQHDSPATTWIVSLALLRSFQQFPVIFLKNLVQTFLSLASRIGFNSLSFIQILHSNETQLLPLPSSARTAIVSYQNVPIFQNSVQVTVYINLLISPHLDVLLTFDVFPLVPCFSSVCIFILSFRFSVSRGYSRDCVLLGLYPL